MAGRFAGPRRGGGRGAEGQSDRCKRQNSKSQERRTGKVKKRIAAFITCLLALLLFVSGPAVATQYNPPWADAYGFNMPAFDTRDFADEAENYLDYAGY